jgi:cytochrome b561
MMSRDPSVPARVATGTGHGPDRYTRTAICLHWAVAILAIFMLVLGYVMVWVPRETPLRGPLFDLHKSLGMIVFLLMISRLAWRLRYRPPALAGVPRATVILALTVHWLLYGLLLLQPLTGYLASAFGSYGVAFFGLPAAPFIAPNPAARAGLLTAHHVLAWLLTALAGLHVLAAWLHHAQRRPDIAARMSVRRVGGEVRAPHDRRGGSAGR